MYNMNKTLHTIVDIGFRDITTFGGAIFYILLVFSLFLLNQKEIVYILSGGFMITLIITIIIRLLYFRPRPKKQGYHNIVERIDASSFPSLHTARMVFLAGVGIQSFRNTITTISLIVFALSVLYSRIHLKKHDWIDVLGGIVVGVGTYFGVLYWV